MPGRWMGCAELLEVRDVALRFGGIVALDGISFNLAEGQIRAYLGKPRELRD